jgi:alkylhydroperoxidase/carboxymuconolactone decarboxylase family protein YurZ
LTRRHDQRARIHCQLHGPGRTRLGRARQNGLTETELKEMIIHLAFYAGWPRAMSAIFLARELFDGGDAQ